MLSSQSLTPVGSDLERELRRVVEGEVRFDAYSRLLYSTDASMYQVEPIGGVLPRSKDDGAAGGEGGVGGVGAPPHRVNGPRPAAGGGHEPHRPDRQPRRRAGLLEVHE